MRPAEKAEHHVAGPLLVVTITAPATYVEQHAEKTLRFAVSKAQHTKAGADLTHGIMYHKVHISVAATDQQEHTAASTGWVAMRSVEIFGQVVVVELLLATADVAGADGAPAA